MIPHLHRHIPHPCQPGLVTVRRFPNRKWFLIPLAALAVALALASCSGGDSSPKPSPPPVTDTRPVGEGLKVIGYAMLGAACVVVLGKLIRS